MAYWNQTCHGCLLGGALQNADQITKMAITAVFNIGPYGKIVF